MRILITAGGTSEKIDDVRAITNHSTGSLGQAIAKEWLQYPEVAIDYVTTKTAKQPPTDPRVTCHFIEVISPLLLIFQKQRFMKQSTMPYQLMTTRSLRH